MAQKGTLSRLASWLEVQRDEDANVEIYVNKDTRPLPPSRRPYGPWEFVGLWMITGSFNVGGWTTGSALISLGLNVWQSMLAIIVAHSIAGLLCVAGGHPGAKWHIGFPLWMKQNWGIWGYLCPMAIRVFLSFVWTSTNVWYGSQCLKVFITCIWPSFRDLNGELANGTMEVCDIATHMWSQSDYTRYARKPGDQILAQLVMVPLGTIVVGCIGIICTSCAATLYPMKEGLLWQPYVFLDTIREQEGNRGARAGVAFASIAFMFSQFGMVVASNLVVAGIDLAALLPRWFTIRRGAYSTLACAFIMQPWSLLNSATSFLTVVGSFNVFLGPLMGIMFADYFILRKRTIKLTDLYGNSQESIYWYAKGWNWRAAVAWVLGVWFLLPGLAQRGMDPKGFWGGWTRLYQMGWFVGCLVSGVVFLALDYVSPMPDKLAVDDADYFGTFGDAPVINGLEEKHSPSESIHGEKLAMDEKTSEV
ncbi:hypothetical protein ACHAPI_008431 [Fusarium lateritium]